MNGILYKGTRGETHIYELIIEQTDGNLVFNNDRLIIENARNVSFLFRRKGTGKVPSFVEAKKRHRKDYQELFNRVEMYLGDQVQLPLNERIARVKRRAVRSWPNRFIFSIWTLLIDQFFSSWEFAE